MDKYGTELADFAKIRAKASRHAKNNPKALFRTELSEGDDAIAGNDTGCDDTAYGLPAHLRSGGGYFGVEDFAKAGRGDGCENRCASDDDHIFSTFQAHDMMQLVGYDMTGEAARQVYEQAGIGPEDVDVAELHDCFAHNELITYEYLSLCGEGQGRNLSLMAIIHKAAALLLTRQVGYCLKGIL